MRAILGLVAAALLLAGCGERPPAKYYYYPRWGFSVAMPSPPKVIETPAGAGGPRSFVVADEAGADDFAVSAADLGPNVKDIDQIADMAAPAVAKTVGGEVGPRTYVATVQTTNQAMGREITINKDGRPFATLRLYVVGDRLYELVGRTSFGPDDPAAKAFLDSFTIIAGPPAAATAPAPTNAD
jgi:hypothetical protein